MKLTEKLRNIIFFQKDKWNGSLINNHLDDLSQWQGSQTLKPRLMDLLEHAAKTTRFYQNHEVSKGIESFPVVNKTIIKNNESDFLSSSFEKADLIRSFTSGSTGTPFVNYQNKNKKERNTADTIFFAGLAGYDTGNKLYYFKIWNEKNRKSNLYQKIQNIRPIDVLNLNKNLPEIINRLNKNESTINLLGYVSAFETLCQWLEQNKSYKLEVKIDSLITMSESLCPETKKVIQKHFKCPVFSRYSNIENGIIAQQTPQSGEDFILNTASYYIEILNLENDNLALAGEMGRIVVTDFFNKAMPFIRYDTGDIGVKSSSKINDKKYDVLTRIGGRKLDQIYNTSGDLISSYVVYKNMWAYDEIEQYQLIQKNTKKYMFKIGMKEKFTREAELIAQFKIYLGEDANFNVEYVTEIPLLSSGKRKKVVNEMNLKV